MKIVEGDLLKLAQEGKFDVIVHGCNCFCTMGKGIAKQIRDTYPEVYTADKSTEKGDVFKLGTMTAVTVKADDTLDSHRFIIMNAYTQYNYRPTYKNDRVVYVNYDAIRACFRRLKNMLIRKDVSHYKIGYPMIGCGLAGGDWDIVSRIIDEELDGLDHTLVKYKG